MVKLVTKKASSEARQRADRIIRDIHKLLGKEYRFFLPAYWITNSQMYCSG